MKFSEEVVKTMCSGLLARFTTLVDEANLNGATASAILGISRSRYTQLAKQPEKPPMLQTHVFLNLMWGVETLEQGMADGWLPAGGFKGAAQKQAVAKLEELAS